MKNIDYIYREDKEHIFECEDKLEKINIKDLLEKEYSYINESVNSNNYNIRLNECDIFKELICNQKVVGFVTYNKISRQNKLLTNIYIIEGYRRRRLFSKEISYQYKNSNKITIYEPNKLIIEVLIKLGYAKQINDSLLISAINFNMQLSEALSNSTEDLPEKLKVANMYDTNICATLSFKIFTKTKYTVYYTKVLAEDKNRCEQARKNMDKTYFDNIVKYLIDCDMEIQRWLYLLRNNLPKTHIYLEDIIGTTQLLPEVLQEKVSDNTLTIKEARKIQNQIIIEQKTNKVDKYLIPLRLEYLIENIHNKSLKQDESDDLCPYCYEHKPILEHYCTTCGYNFFDINQINDEEYVYSYLLKHKQSYKYSLTGKLEYKTYRCAENTLKLAMCDILTTVLEYEVDIGIFFIRASEYGLDEMFLENALLNKYVTFDMTPEKWEDEGNNYTNNDLKAILKENGCKISGNKYELIQRIKNEVPLEFIQSDTLSITEEGTEFLNENFEFLTFTTFLEDYIYEEYEDFLKNKKNTENVLENIDEFLQKHIEHAIETENHDQLVDTLDIQSELAEKRGDIDTFIDLQVKILLLNLNMYYIDSKYYSYYKPLTKQSYDIFFNLKEYLVDLTLSESINRAYESLDKSRLKVRDYDVADVFKDIFKHYSFTGINGRIQRKYYKKAYERIRDVKKIKSNKITTLDRFF